LPATFIGVWVYEFFKFAVALTSRYLYVATEETPAIKVDIEFSNAQFFPI